MLKSFVRSALKTAGFRLVREPNSSEYGSIIPRSDYTPWNTDSRFLDTYRTISKNTLVDIYRCWELWTLAGQAAKLAPGAFLEVGVWRGGTGALLAKGAALGGQSDPVYLCDTFTGVVKAGSEDSYYQGGEHSDTSKELVERLLRSLDLTNVRIVEGIFPNSADATLENSRFRLVHIDVDVYQSAKDVLEWVWPRLVPGGMVIYDDYGFSFCSGITKTVNEQVADPGKLVFHNLNGHAVVVKTAP